MILEAAQREAVQVDQEGIAQVETVQVDQEQVLAQNRCIKLHAQNADASVKSLSSHVKAGMFSAKNASARKENTDY